MAKIKIIKAREILDSRGNPTLETKIILDNLVAVQASVPSGASLGKYEAVELRDGDLERFNGLGVLNAVANVNEVMAPELIGKDPLRQKEIDDLLVKLDGTENKSKLGANAVLSVSIAVCKAGAKVLDLPVYQYLGRLFPRPGEFKIPVPLFNLINGGKHGAGNLDFQEFHVIPSETMDYNQALEAGEEIYQAVKKILIRHKAIHSVGDEGGFAPNLFTNADALEIMVEAVKEAGYVFGKNIFLGLDAAASHFYQAGKYRIKDRTMPLEPEDLARFYQDLSEEYPLYVLEDPFHEDDWEGWKKISQRLTETIIIGDDLLATNKKRVVKAIGEKACRAILIKPNQAGTISETMAVAKMSQEAGWKVVVSHRSGETNDDFIADFAVGIHAEHVKFGAPARGERVVKYNRLLAIESEIKSSTISQENGT